VLAPDLLGLERTPLSGRDPSIAAHGRRVASWHADPAVQPGDWGHDRARGAGLYGAERGSGALSFERGVLFHAGLDGVAERRILALRACGTGSARRAGSSSRYTRHASLADMDAAVAVRLARRVAPSSSARALLHWPGAQEA